MFWITGGAGDRFITDCFYCSQHLNNLKSTWGWGLHFILYHCLLSGRNVSQSQQSPGEDRVMLFTVLQHQGETDIYTLYSHLQLIQSEKWTAILHVLECSRKLEYRFHTERPPITTGNRTSDLLAVRQNTNHYTTVKPLAPQFCYLVRQNTRWFLNEHLNLWGMEEACILG